MARSKSGSVQRSTRPPQPKPSAPKRAQPTPTADRRRPPGQADPLIDAVSAVRYLVLHVVAIANWTIVCACFFGFAGRLVWPLVPDDAMTRGFLEMGAVSLGACLGKLLQRRSRRKHQDNIVGHAGKIAERLRRQRPLPGAHRRDRAGKLRRLNFIVPACRSRWPHRRR